MKEKIVRNILFPFISWWRGESILPQLIELQASQYLSKQQLAEIQEEKLKRVLTHAYHNSSYYQEVFDEIGLHPSSSELTERMKDIPILDKQTFRKNIHKIKSRQPLSKIDSRRTSGSTGVPLNILKSRKDFGRIRARLWRYYSWHNIHIGDLQARFLGHPVTFKSKLIEDIQDIALNKMRLDPVYMNERTMSKFYKSMCKKRPKYIYGYPSAIHQFSLFLQDAKPHPSELCLHSVICTGETLQNQHKETIEKIFNCKAINEYGCSEVGIIAFPCEHNRMHLSCDDLYIEIVKDDRIHDKTLGRIVVTELYNYDVPSIRYEIGDMCSLEVRDDCPCNRGLPYVERIQGRSSELIKLKDGRYMHSEIFHYFSDAIVEKHDHVKHFRVSQMGIDDFKVEIVTERHFSKETEDFIKKLFYTKINKDVKVDIELLDQLPKDVSGKLRYFVPMTDH